jgi:hypothetical protein
MIVYQDSYSERDSLLQGAGKVIVQAVPRAVRAEVIKVSAFTRNYTCERTKS